jgi:PKD repeat protein
MKIVFKVGFSILAFFQLSFSQEIPGELSLSDSLVAYYPFTGKSDDASGNGYHGLTQGTLLTEDKNGHPDCAYLFNGEDSYIKLPYHSINFKPSLPITIAAWIKLNSYALPIFTNDYQDNIYSGVLLFIDSSGKVGITIGDGGEIGPNSRRTKSGSTILDVGTWYHLTAVVKNSNNMDIFIDGINDGGYYHGNGDGLYYSKNGDGNIGRKDQSFVDGAPSFFDGTIDEVYYYNRILNNNEIQYLYSGVISANFVADTTTGMAPFTVQFTDASSTLDSVKQINSWKWDFDNDGVIDSEIQNPEWTFLEYGIYTVKLMVSDSINQDIEIKENYIAVFSENPVIYSVIDIPNDQGGWVKLNFLGSSYDTDSLILAKTFSPEIYTVELLDANDWTAATSTLAYGKSIYSVLVPTLRDSTSDNDGLINFRVIAGMEEGNYVSNIMPGYSVDNLHPSTPQDLSGYLTPEKHAILAWDSVPDEDFKYFIIFRRTIGSLFEEVASTIDTIYIDDTVVVDNSYQYSLKAVDNSGNESDFSNIIEITITDIIRNSTTPAQYYLSQNFPNPFNPQTIIEYGLLRQSEVKITIYDILGHKLVELVESTKNPGHHQVVWNGTNNSGQFVSSGIYFYKLETDNFNAMKKMLLIR